MKRIFFCLLISSLSLAQSNLTRWEDHFSYASIRGVVSVDNLLYCAAENGVFSFDPVSKETSKISKVSLLNAVGITSMSYNKENDALLIGYERGVLDVLNKEGSTAVLDIPWNSYNGDKKVRHISTYNDVGIISGEFGVTIYDLKRLEFRETAFFVQGGEYFGVNEAVVLDGVIYAATSRGVFYHPLNEYISNFPAWKQPQGLPLSNFSNITVFNGHIFTNNNNTIYRFDGNNWSIIGSYSEIQDLNSNQDALSIVLPNRILSLDNNLTIVDDITFIQKLNTGIKHNNVVYGGSVLYGLVNKNNQQEINLKGFMPDGPYNNLSWFITVLKEQLWISPGGMSSYNSPSRNLDGFYHFDGKKWIHNKSENLDNVNDVIHISINPKDITEVFASTWGAGVVKVKDDQMAERYTINNSALTGLQRVGGSTLDEEGNLWIAQGYGNASSASKDNILAVLRPDGKWESRHIHETTVGVRYPVVALDYVWIAHPRAGGISVVSKDLKELYIIDSDAGKGNLPSKLVYTLAVDKDGTAWFGTESGLHILNDPIYSLKKGSYDTQPIVIMQNGIPEVLLKDTRINAIAVDGANRKWIATESSGVFYVSSSGDNTIFHFTTSNSPLPSNRIYDIAVDDTTGRVYFATEKGMVSYKGDIQESSDSFGDVLAYPNPVRPGFNGKITIKGLPNYADVKIVDVVGNLIFQTQSAGGVVEWDTKNSKGKSVASGVYLVLMTNRDGSKTKTTKIAIVR